MGDLKIGWLVVGVLAIAVVVIGGSQGARILSDVVPEAISRLPEDVLLNLRVAHQAREEDAARVTAFYRKAGIDAEVKPFFEDIPRRFSEAQLIISRAGASSVADISVIGRPSIHIPYAAATADHQTANARQLVEADAAILIPEKRLDPETLAAQIELVLANPQAAAKMAGKARTAGIPDATGRLVALVEDLTGIRQDAP